MADTHAEAEHHKHPYHLVDPSPWPILGAISAGALAAGAVLWMHNEGPWLMIVGFMFVLACMYVWWRDVVREGNNLGYHNPIVQIGLRYGMVLFIASEVMFFSASSGPSSARRCSPRRRSTGSGRRPTSRPSIRSRFRSSTR